MLKVIGGRLINFMALATINALRRQNNVEPLDSVWNQVHRAVGELILTSAAFDFPAELPANARYVGPILDGPQWATGEALDFPLGDLPVRGVLTTGPAARVEQIRAPSNVEILGAAPHAQIMQKADLIITHGGHGTVIKALAARVPLLILPPWSRSARERL